MSGQEAARAALERVGAYATRLTRWAPLPGGVLLVTDAEGGLAEAAFGSADLERGLPMSVEHRFQLGSISKSFTGLVVALLADRGLFSLDDRAVELLPWLDLGPEGADVTVRALLNHNGGLIMGADVWPDDLAQLVDLRRSGARRAATAHFHYSNVGYLALGRIAERFGGAPLHRLVEELVLEPLAMAHTAGAVRDDDRAEFAVGYAPARQDRPWVPGDRLAPAAWFESAGGDGNVGGTAGDLARFQRLYLNQGEIAGRAVVPAHVIESTYELLGHGGEPILEVPGIPPVTASHYGLGVNVERVAGHRLLSHGGGMVGYSTFSLVDLDAQLGVVVLTNANGDNLYAQQLARLTHADLLARRSGAEPPPLPDPDPTVRSGADVPVGTFGHGRHVLHVTPAADGGPLNVELDGRTGRLFATMTGRYVTDLSELRDFRLDVDAGGWVHGPTRLGAPAEQQDHPAVGHYRTHSPWFPVLRIYRRDGRLWLTAPGGVEAPTADEELVELAPGHYRVGAEDWLPERLSLGAVVDGRAVTVDKDGCTYSRTFRP